MERSGYIALIGKPNVGKSTLINALLKEKLSAVSRKQKTTRHQIMGILNLENVQAIFVDTPGLIIPKDKLDKRITKATMNTIYSSDICVLLVEPFEREIIPDFLKKQHIILAINKIDLVDKPTLLPLIEYYNGLSLFSTIVPISSKKGINLGPLLNEIIGLLPFHPPFYEKDIISIHHERFFVCEIIREKIFLFYKDEIPYQTEVLVEEFKETERGKDYIKAIIYTDKKSQKGILIGKDGCQLKRIGRLARMEIEKFHQKAVYLELIVQDKRHWRKNDKILNALGY